MRTSFDRIVVLDFEATCQPGAPPSPQEIIEFPSVLVSLPDRAVVDSFSTFVRPVHHPVLSDFCTELTSIRQQDVDPAPPFLDVLAAHQAWLESHGLLDSDGPRRFAFVTCGDWDLQTMLPAQCAASGLPITALPPAYRRWINIKTVFLAVMRKAKSLGMPAMLRALGLELEGTHHRGIDDCHNIARIAFALADRGARFELTSKLAASHYPELPLELQRGDRVEPAVLRKRHLASLLGLASGLFRAKIVRAYGADGAELGDDALAELAPGARVHVAAARDPAPALSSSPCPSGHDPSATRHYAYVGPSAIRERPRAAPGAIIEAALDLEQWLRARPDALAEGATYVVDRRGRLRLAPRRSEHIDCAGGDDVLAAGELRLAREDGRARVVEISNQSTGYCPDPDCWPAVAAALARAGVPGPPGFTHAFVFRRCPRCAEVNLVKDDWFVCAACDAELPRAWNFSD